ncbi:MAG: HlyD family efflux transporter periplasmic adaptor subunit [Litorimonas sp.]
MEETRRTISNLRENKFNLAQQGVITLVSPIDGRVAAIPVTEGVAVAQNDLMATILPAGGKLEAELFVPSKDASLVKIGQKVRIKYHGFPYQRYGVMTGSVDSFSKTIFLPSEISGMFQSNEPAYRIIIELDQQEIQASNQTFPLQSGMTLDADIVYGREKLWRLFFQER